MLIIIIIIIIKIMMIKKRARLTGDAVTLLVWLKGACDVVDEYINKKKKRS